MRLIAQTKKSWIHVFLLLALAFIVFRTPAAAYAEEARFKVTIYWVVWNENSDRDNKILLSYWEPSGDGYKVSDKTKEIPEVANKEKDFYSASFDLPGPPHSIKACFHGSAFDEVEYALEKVEVQPINPVSNTGLPDTFTLWEGKLQCHVATTFGSSLYNELYFNNAPGHYTTTPSFSGWLDIDSNEEDKWGHDRIERTDGYYEEGCKNPAPYGINGFSVNPDSSELSVPTNNTPASYDLDFNSGVLYDCFGAQWPSQSSYSLSLSSNNKNLQVYESDGSWYLKVNPNSNASSDYEVEITQNKHGFTDSDKLTIRTFDYNFTFLDENGNEIGKQTADYGASVSAPFVEGSSFVVWNCDTFSDWQNTTDGPCDRTVKAKDSSTQGKGTKEDPYRIKTFEDWNQFVQHLKNVGTKGEYYRLENNISVNCYAAKERPFEGVFDGNGKAITFNVSYDQNGAALHAPFCKTKEAAILNLTVDGTMVPSDVVGNNLAGLVGDNEGATLIKNCTVLSSLCGAETGGFVHRAGGALTIEDCVFHGKLSVYDQSAGFVAHGSKELVLRNCLFDPINAWYSNGVITEGNATYTNLAIANATFVNGDYATLENCRYTVDFGMVKQGQSVSRQSSQSSAEKEKEEQANAQYKKEVAAAQSLKVGGVKVKAKAGRKALITWKKNKSADGYQIRFSTNRKFKKSVKTVKVSKSKAKKTLTKLKAGKVWYVQVRPYTMIKNPSDGKTTAIYGKWSAVRKCKAKK